MIQILYFASIREQLNRADEQLELPESVNTVAELREFLVTRDGVSRNELSSNNILIAVNQTIVNNDEAVHDGDEVAFFPQVTGG